MDDHAFLTWLITLVVSLSAIMVGIKLDRIIELLEEDEDG